MSQQPAEEMVSVRDAAKRLGRSEEQVRRYLRSGLLAGRRIGGQWFIPASNLKLPEGADNLPRDVAATREGATAQSAPAELAGPTPQAVAARQAALQTMRAIRQATLQRTGRAPEVEVFMSEIRPGSA